MIHELKIEKEYYINLISENKKSEIRLNDRDYQCDDILMFIVFDKGIPFISDTENQFIITHIHSGLGMENGYVVLSVQKFKKDE